MLPRLRPGRHESSRALSVPVLRLICVAWRAVTRGCTVSHVRIPKLLVLPKLDDGELPPRWSGLGPCGIGNRWVEVVVLRLPPDDHTDGGHAAGPKTPSISPATPVRSGELVDVVGEG